MPVIDQIISAIQASIDELLGEIERLRRALAALTSRESEPERSQRATPDPSAGGSAAKSPRGAARRTPRTRRASVPPAPSASRSPGRPLLLLAARAPRRAQQRPRASLRCRAGAR